MAAELCSETSRMAASSRALIRIFLFTALFVFCITCYLYIVRHARRVSQAKSSLSSRIGSTRATQQGPLTGSASSGNPSLSGSWSQSESAKSGSAPTVSSKPSTRPSPYVSTFGWTKPSAPHHRFQPTAPSSPLLPAPVRFQAPGSRHQWPRGGGGTAAACPAAVSPPLLGRCPRQM